jgi:signal transduction histidine kinase
MSSKILIVDDDPLGIDTLESILAEQGYDITSASNGPTALKKASEISPDLILLDVMMPGMDGFEVCRRIRATPKIAEVPIIILTALDDRSSRLRGIESGADDFLTKPVDRQELRLRVKTISRLNRYRILLTQRENLRQMAEHVVTAQEEERKRLSRELHDDLGQALIAHALSLRNLQLELPLQADLLNTRLDSLTTDANQIIQRMHALAHDIRPTLLDTLGIRSALETHCREFSFRTGLPVIFEADLELPEMPDVYSITLYRILQEALTNVIKHSHARQVWVVLSLEEHNITLTIQDNGTGFILDENETRNGIGITSLRERVTLVGGELAISSSAAKGTIISARLPIEDSELIEEQE